MKRQLRSDPAKRAYSRGNAIAIRNKARHLGATLEALRTTDDAYPRWLLEYQKIPTTTLGDYQAMNDVAGALIDQGREPYLINRENLSCGMHPFVEIWDVGRETAKVARGGRSFFSEEMASVCVRQGDALLPLNTVIAWC